jgi:hypothetical protein
MLMIHFLTHVIRPRKEPTLESLGFCFAFYGRHGLENGQWDHMRILAAIV